VWQDRLRDVRFGHADAVILDADGVDAPVLKTDRQGGGLRVERVLHQFFQHAGRIGDHLARGDLHIDFRGQAPYCHLRVPPPSRPAALSFLGRAGAGGFQNRVSPR